MIVILALLCSCTGKAENTNGDFVIRIRTDKNGYKDGEAIGCHVTVQYVGKRDQITIYTGDPVVGFSLRGGPGLSVNALYSLVLKPTLFERGETKRFEFAKTGAFNEESPPMLKEYLSQKELVLRRGQYTLTAELNYATDKTNVMGSQKQLHTSISITVT